MSDLARLIADGTVRENVPLGPLTTYKAGGPAALLAVADNETKLIELVDAGLFDGRPTLILGRGSNVVVADEGFDGVVLRLGSWFASIDIEDGSVSAGGAVPLPKLARAVVDGGFIGLEFFVGVPGSVGGAIRQNAGCFGIETKDVLISASLIDLTTGLRSSRTSDELGLAYRSSTVAANELVVSASFNIRSGDLTDARQRMRDITRWRKEHQPGGTLNAGSVFKNPPGQAAGEIIDRLGLKGLTIGDVSVSEKHANFFVAGPGATAADVAELVAVVKDRVEQATGTILEPEIQFVGFEE